MNGKCLLLKCTIGSICKTVAPRRVTTRDGHVCRMRKEGIYMKRSKQLLCFVIPALCIMAAIGLSFLLPEEQGGAPHFTGRGQYFRLMIGDSSFWTAVFHTFVRPIWLPFAVGLVCFLGLYIAKRRIRQRYGWRCTEAVFYTAVILGTTGICYSPAIRMMRESAPFYAGILYYRWFGGCLLTAVFLCLIFWCVDRIWDRIGAKRRISAGNGPSAHKG